MYTPSKCTSYACTCWEQILKVWKRTNWKHFTVCPKHFFLNTHQFHCTRIQNSCCHLLSNTGFIQGRTLRKLMATWGWDTLFSFQLYSDETGFSKPDQEMFRKVLEQSSLLHPGLTPSQVWHLGDNQIADVQGALKAGFQATLTDVNTNPLNTLLNERCICLT
jgi:putative hydrolase of the HAD superfamily